MPAPRPPLTHFLCLPLLTPASKPQLQTSLQHFAASVTVPADAATAPIPRTAIRPLGTLHLTLGVMSLPSRDKLDAALSVLKACDPETLLRNVAASASPEESRAASADRPDVADAAKGPLAGLLSTEVVPPLVLSLKHLQPMHGPSSTSILYAVPDDPTHRLYAFCLALRSVFADAGLLVPDTRALLLHATVVNTVYARRRSRRRRGGGHGEDARGRGGFDAREVLERFGHVVWAEGVRVERVAMCEMGARKVGGGNGEEYIEVGSVELP